MYPNIQFILKSHEIVVELSRRMKDENKRPKYPEGQDKKYS